MAETYIHKLVVVTPNPPGTTLTARASFGSTAQNLGKLNKGEVYWAEGEYQNYYRLAVYQTPFPLVGLPANAEVWADKAYLPFTSSASSVVPPPAPEPPSPNVDSSWKGLIYELCKAGIRWYESL